MFASDNGFFLDEHGIGLPAGTSGNKRAAYQESIRIPLLIRYPALELSGVVLDPIALNIDLAPTILELARIPRPSTMQGKSLLGMITGRSGAVRDRFLYEYFFEVDYEVPTLVAVQRGRYKLIRYRANPAWTELFDLQRDPLETRNLATSADAASIFQSMSDSLDQAMAAVKYRVPSYADPEPTSSGPP